MDSQLPQNSQSYLSDTPLKSRHIHISWAIALIVLTAVLTAAGSYLIVSRKSAVNPDNGNTQLTFLEPSQAPGSVESPYRKRWFDVNDKFFDTRDFPDQVLGIPETALVGIKCTPQYIKNDKEEFGLGTDPSVKLTGETELEMISKSEESLGKVLTTFMQCETEENTTVLIAEVWGGGGGGLNTTYFALVDNTKPGDIKFTELANDGSPYWTCQNPLQLTKDAKMQFQCGGGDGGFGASAVYEIDFQNSEAKTLLRCTSTSKGDGGEAEIVCN